MQNIASQQARSWAQQEDPPPVVPSSPPILDGHDVTAPHASDDLANEQVPMDEFFATYHPMGAPDTVHPETASTPTQPVPSMDRASEKRWEEIKRNAETPLYPGARLSALCYIMQLLDFQAQFGGSNILFDHIMHWLEDVVLPKNNVAPPSQTVARKLLTTIGMDYYQVHACPNDCILYTEDHTLRIECTNPTCGESRY